MKHQKYIVLLILFQTVLLLSCKKDPPVRNNTAPQAMYDLISRDTLEFQSYILKWNTARVDTMYVRDTNVQQLDTAWLKFDKNGTYQTYITKDFTYAASWEFLDNGSRLRLWNDDRKFDQEFILLKLTQDTVEMLNPRLDSLFYRFRFK